MSAFNSTSSLPPCKTLLATSSKSMMAPRFKPPDANRREQLPFYQRTKTPRQRERTGATGTSLGIGRLTHGTVLTNCEE